MSRKLLSEIWFGTVGLDPAFGGVSKVARTSLSALQAGNATIRLGRVISLLDSEVSPSFSAISSLTRTCSGSRVQFIRETFSQIRSKPKLIIYDHLDLAKSQTLLPHACQAPYAIWIHGIEVWKPLSRRKTAALRGASGLFFNSHFTKSRFEEFHGRDYPSTVVPLTSGIKKDTVQPAPMEPRQPWILTVGRIEPGRPKGHEEILEAMPAIVESVPNVEWHIVGKGAALESLAERVADSPFREKIHLHGFLDADELEKLFSRCRVFAMPSRGEGFGIVYLEAMSAGCIPIASTSDAAEEVIGDSGFCINIEQPNELVDRIVSVLTESEERFADRSAQAHERSKSFCQERFDERFLAAVSESCISNERVVTS